MKDAMSTNQTTSASQSVKDGVDVAPRLPSGFRVKSYLGRDYIVPEFLDLTTEQAIAAIHMKDQMNITVDEVSRSTTIFKQTANYFLNMSVAALCYDRCRCRTQAISRK